jgi:hypothetical protein
VCIGIGEKAEVYKTIEVGWLLSIHKGYCRLVDLLTNDRVPNQFYS